jgi:hypothetical protein
VTDDQPPGSSGPAPPTGTARPSYKGAPLDPERGPGLGCFWAQTVVFLILFVLTPFGVVNGWPAWLTTAMFVVTLVLLLFVGQTVIFLLRLVAADRRSRRRPLGEGARPTVGDLSRSPVEPSGDVETGSDEADGPPAVRQ